MTELAATRASDGTWVFDVVTASASIPVKPPRHWFDDPELTEPTALTVTADGRVYGHACTWFSRHVGLPGRVTPPRSKSDYAEYLTGQVETDDGSMVATGRITLGGGHAGLGGDIVAAQQHYDDVSYALVDIHCGEDEIGLWYAGALRPGTTPEQIRALRASSVSGDWRQVNDNLALCAIHAVNVPGFSTPRAHLAASGALTSLVAAGVVLRDPPPAPPEEPPMTTTPEALAAAAPPFAKGEAAPDEAPAGFDTGDTVTIADTKLVAQVVETDDDGNVVVEMAVPADLLAPADEEQALAAAASFTDRMHDRRRDSELRTVGETNRTLSTAVETLTASVESLLAENRAMKAERLVASVGIDA